MDIKLKNKKAIKLIIQSIICIGIFIGTGYSVYSNIFMSKMYNDEVGDEFNQLYWSIEDLKLYADGLNGNLKEEPIEAELLNVKNKIKEYNAGNRNEYINEEYFNKNDEELKEVIIKNFNARIENDISRIRMFRNIEFYYETEDPNSPITNVDINSKEEFEKDTLDNYKDYIIIKSNQSIKVSNDLDNILERVGYNNTDYDMYMRIAEPLEIGDSIYNQVKRVYPIQRVIGYISIVVLIIDVVLSLFVIKNIIKFSKENNLKKIIGNLISNKLLQIKNNFVQTKLIKRTFRMTILFLVLITWLIGFYITFGICTNIITGLLLALIITLIPSIHVFKISASINNIILSIDNISNGSYNQKIVVSSKLFRKLADNIENIQAGLKVSVEEAVKSEKMKSELITNVSHDLKTPLTSIINYVDLLGKDNVSEENKEKYLSVLKEKSNRLKMLIEDLFEISKATSGSMELNMDNLDTGALLKQALGEVEDKRELTFIKKFPKDKLLIYADGRKTFRIFENLLSNIVKYSMPNSRVYIEVNEYEEYICVIFKNVSKYKLDCRKEELMQRFKRGDISRSTEGSGLGLSIAESLTEIQGGIFDIDIDGDLFKAIVKLKKCN